MPTFIKILSFSTFIFLASCSPVVETSEEFAVDGKFDIEKSIEYLDKIIDHDKNNADALFQRAKLELQSEKSLKAKEDISYALSIEPENSDYLMLKARIDHAIGQNSEALSSIEAIVKKGELLNNVEDQLFATKLYLNANNINKAEYYLQQAALIAPEYPDVLYNRARLSLILHDTARALTFYKQILKKDSAHKNSLIDLAEISLNKNNVDSTLILLSKTSGEQSLKYYKLIASALSRKGLFDSASKFWGQALLLAPKDGLSHYELGKYYYHTGFYQNAAYHFSAIQENDRKRFKDYFLMYAYSSQQLADSVRAEQLFHQARLNDSNLVIHKELQARHRSIH